VTSAPARFILEGAPHGPKSMACTYLYLPDPKWLTMPIRVISDTGTPVGSDLLWAAPGEPAILLFDAAPDVVHYEVYVGSNWPPMHLPDTQSGVWLETREGDGKIINNLPDMLQAWKQSTKVVGRALLSGIFEGGNRFGPQRNLLLHFQGWFDVAAPEHLQLADDSVDASFVLVDGKEVVEWPGQHERWWGPTGPPQGAVDLTPGRHLLDYYYAYVMAETPGPPPLSCSLAVKGGLFKDWTMLQPGNTFFRPFTNLPPFLYELQSSSPVGSSNETAPVLAIKWENGDQSVIDTDQADIGLIAMQLTCLSTVTGTLTWTFDDGSTAQGQTVTHLFPRPGMRSVKLTLMDGGKQVASLSQTIAVHSDWTNVNKLQGLHPEQEADIMGRDPATLSASDLVGCMVIFQACLKTDDLLHLLPAVCAKMKDMSEADLPYLKDTALYLSREDWAHPDDVTQLLRGQIDRASAVSPPTPAAVAVLSECRLALARLVLETTDHTDEARTLMEGIDVHSLGREEPRRLNMLKADLALATGDVAGARTQYETLTGEPSGPDVRSSIRRTAKISQARAFLDRKDFDAAEGSLKEVAWQAPIEKMSPDWALTRLRAYQDENRPVVAYVWAKRLLPVITEGSRSELLFRLTDLAFAQGDNDLAHKTLSELLKKHPYSEEAAQAKEKWPGQG
jgi:PKD repeat protein